MSPTKPELKAVKENHPISGICHFSTSVLITEGTGKVRGGRVIGMEDADLERYLWPRNSLWLSYWLFSKGQTAPNFQRKPLEKNFCRRDHYVNFPKEIKARVRPVMSCSISLHAWRSSL